MQFPEQLKYKLTKPTGFPASIKEVKFLPVASQNSWGPTDTIRWEIRSNGFLDPYSVRLNFDVQVDDLSPEEIRRLDGSAHSFFDQLIIQSRGIVIERLQEYQVLAQILHDMNYSPGDRKVKTHEGHGISDYGQGEFSKIHVNHNLQTYQRNHMSGRTYDPTNPCYPTGSIMVNSTANDILLEETYTQHATVTQSSTISQQSNLPISELFPPTLAATSVSTMEEQKYYNRFRHSNSGNVHASGSSGGTLVRYEGHNLGYCAQATVASMDIQGNNWAMDRRCYFEKLKRNWQYVQFANQPINSALYPSSYPKKISQTVTDTFQATVAGNQCQSAILRSTPESTMSWPSTVKLFNYVNSGIFSSGSPGGSVNNNAQDYVVAFNEYLETQFQNTQAFSDYVQSGLGSVQPWTYTTNDCSTVYEFAEDDNNLDYVRARSDIKTFHQPGQTQKIQIQENPSGYRNPFNNLYCAGSDEPYFAGTDIQVKQIVKGKIESRMGRKYMSFSIPLLSSIFGVLLPPDLYKFIPLSIFEDLIIEMQCSQYALFSSGYKSNVSGTNLHTNEVVDYRPLSQQNLYLLTQQNTRNYKIVKMEMVADVMNFSQTVEDIVKQQWNSEQGIIFQTNFFALGPQYTFENSGQVNGTHQINLAFNSLKSMFWKFIPLDYEKYSFCRKNFSIHNNLTKFQLILGQDLIPQDGVRGQAGTPEGDSLNQYQTNREFFTHTLKVFNKHHDMTGNINLNPYNFSINDRCYDPTKKGSYYRILNLKQLGQMGQVYTDNDVVLSEGDFSYNVTLQSNQNVVQNKPSVHVTGARETYMQIQNAHTALQMPGFHECRVVGKSLFGFVTGTFESDNSVLSGLNTYDFKPFNINFETDQDNEKAFKRSSRLFMFFNYDAVVQLRAGSQPTVIGRA